MFKFIFRSRFNWIDAVAMLTLVLLWGAQTALAICLYILLTLVSVVCESLLKTGGH